MRVRHRIAIAAGCTAAIALTAPSGASAQCHTPKGWYVAGTQYQYSLFTESGQEFDALAHLLGVVHVPIYIDPRTAPAQALALLSGFGTATVQHSTALAEATGTYATAMLTALREDPPGCATSAVKRKKKSRRR